MNDNDEEKAVSDFYHAIDVSKERNEPSVDLDNVILQAAITDSEKNRSTNKRFNRFSAVASVFVVVSVALISTLAIEDNTNEYTGASVIKQPMYMLQRSKPASPEEMVSLIKGLVAKGQLDQAQVLYKKIKVRYPSYEIDSSLIETLK